MISSARKAGHLAYPGLSWPILAYPGNHYPLLYVCCRAPVVYTQLQSSPTQTCFTGTSSYPYSTFFGNTSSWAHITSWSALYYNTTAPTWFAWNNGAACSTAYVAMCEIPVARYACPTSPPPARPPPPTRTLCEWHAWLLPCAPAYMLRAYASRHAWGYLQVPFIAADLLSMPGTQHVAGGSRRNVAMWQYVYRLVQRGDWWIVGHLRTCRTVPCPPMFRRTTMLPPARSLQACPPTTPTHFATPRAAPATCATAAV
jgi:hypothetical protein